MSHQYKPMLAQTAAAPFNSAEWIFEIKWDGIRAISYVKDEVSIKSRNGKELITNFPELQELNKLTINAVLDGEIVVLKDGRSDFQAILERRNAASTQDIEYLAQRFPAVYIIFDILEKDNKVLVDMPLLERKNILKAQVREGEYVILSEYIDEMGEPYYQAAIERGIEGVVAKKKDSPYEPGVRSKNWQKMKKIATCDCVIFGRTIGEGKRKTTFGALILGLYHNSTPVYVGKVGTGLSQADLELLSDTFKKLEVKEKTLEGVEIPEEIVWLSPQLVCEVGYQAVTPDGRLRMPRFRGLRFDKDPFDCTLDQVKQFRLNEYLKRRNFTLSPEPVGKQTNHAGKIFVVQEHHARRLHYDFRLERNGVLKSWAVPRGFPLDGGEKRLAVETEDHPLEYSDFEGTIPTGQYGAGTVTIWDRGSYELLVWKEDKIELNLFGGKLRGTYVLARLKKTGDKEWLLLKTRDKNG